MKFKAKILIIFLFVFYNLISAQGMSKLYLKSADDFFKKFVVKGRVDYLSIKDNPTSLNNLLDMISTSDFSNLPQGNQEKAILINIYNMLVIKAVLNEYPLKSVMDIGGFFDTPIITNQDNEYSLNDIEKDILFEKYADPRLHFVLVCAAIGCPQIIGKGYFPDMLEIDLDTRSQVTLNSTNYVRVETESKKVYVSELFKWYEKDFTQNGLSIIQYINQYREEKIPQDFSVSYITYDWTLNDIIRKRRGALLPERENLQAYTPSILLKPGQSELKFFNNLYTQTAYFDEQGTRTELNERSTYYTGILNFLYGFSQNLNIGFDFFFKSVLNDSESGSPLKVFQFSNDANSRTAPTQIGPKLKFTPIASIRNLSIQTAFLFPLASDMDGSDNPDSPFLDVDGNQWWTQIFYDYLIKNDFLLFFETGLLLRFGSTFDDALTPVKFFFNYFPSQKWTIYAMGEFAAFWKDGSVSAYYNQYGLGGKYQITSNFELEILFTKFVFGKSQGAGETYNLGLRVII